MLSRLLLTITFVVLLDIRVAENTECDPAKCQLPSCHCPTADPPNGLRPKDIPQIVIFSFDDQIKSWNADIYRNVFQGSRLNPNGCPITATFFVCQEVGTDYGEVQDLYLRGHEISTHSVNHHNEHTWWQEARFEDWVDEFVGMRKKLVDKAGIPEWDIRGMRAPFLEISDDQFRMMETYNFFYDATFMTGRETNDTVNQWIEPVWPFTLDYAPIYPYCDNPNCPKYSYPGLWEIPLQRMIGVDGVGCAMTDSCNPSALQTKRDLQKYFSSNFNDHYFGKRAPLGIHLHAKWLTNARILETFDEFIQNLTKFDDVYIISMYQLLLWVEEPTPLRDIQSFLPWRTSCGGKELLHRQSKTSRQLQPLWSRAHGMTYLKTITKLTIMFDWVQVTCLLTVVVLVYIFSMYIQLRKQGKIERTILFNRSSNRK